MWLSTLLTIHFCFLLVCALRFLYPFVFKHVYFWLPYASAAVGSSDTNFLAVLARYFCGDHTFLHKRYTYSTMLACVANCEDRPGHISSTQLSIWWKWDLAHLFIVSLGCVAKRCVTWVSLLLCAGDMPISLEQWRLAVGLWNARIQWTLIIRRGVKRAPSRQEGSSSASLQSHNGEKMFKTKKKVRMKHKDGTLGDPVVATDNFYDDSIVLGAPTTMCSGENECRDGSSRPFVVPLLEQLGCTMLGALLLIVMLLFRSGDVERNPGPVEGGG